MTGFSRARTSRIRFPTSTTIRTASIWAEKRGDTTGKGLPGVALFSFDSGANIRQLQIYIDRYALMQSITKGKGNWDAPGGN